MLKYKWIMHELLVQAQTTFEKGKADWNQTKGNKNRPKTEWFIFQVFGMTSNEWNEFINRQLSNMDGINKNHTGQYHHSEVDNKMYSNKQQEQNRQNRKSDLDNYTV